MTYNNRHDQYLSDGILTGREQALQERVFKKLFQQAEIAQYDENERRNYEASLKEYWDYTSSMDTAFMKGERKGREEGVKEGQKKEKEDTFRRLATLELTIEQIAQGTGLTAEKVKSFLS